LFDNHNLVALYNNGDEALQYIKDIKAVRNKKWNAEAILQQNEYLLEQNIILQEQLLMSDFVIMTLFNHVGQTMGNYITMVKLRPNIDRTIFSDDITNQGYIKRSPLSSLKTQKRGGVNTITRHNLEKKYLAWIKKQPVAKFNGYPYELYQAAKVSGRSLAQKYTYDAQFNQLIETAKKDVDNKLLEKGVLCALDTSGSMGSTYWGVSEGQPQPIDVCVGLGIYFSSLLKGAFADHVIMFDNTSRMLKLQGSFCEKVDQITAQGWAMGGTNFQSVIDEIVRVRKLRPEIPVEDYPEVLLVVSDMQYNATGTLETNYEMIKRKLAKVGLPPMTCIFWQVNGRHTQDVPARFDEPGIVLISGFDGSIVTSILGCEDVIDQKTGEKRKPTPAEVMEKALDQEILNRLRV